MNVSLIIAAAGSSKRMGGSVKKQYLLLKNLPVLIRSVKAFCAFKEIIQIIVVCPSEDEYFVKELLNEYKLSCQVVCGGKERQDSIRNALKVLNEKTDYVLIHDGARPFVGEDVIESILGELQKGAKAVVPGVQPKNTIRTKTKTLNRDELFEVQTPQGFEKNCLIDAYKKAFDENFYGTDDAGLVERLGVEVVISKGSYKNIKITTKEDLEKEMRIGQGYDVHKMVEGRKLMLGCTEIPYEKGLLGHSDADVLSHAIADALLGAAALGDIGKIFPDTAKETEGMPGSEILKQTMELLRCRGFEIVNIDSTIVAQKPKLMPYIDKMRENIATALEIDKELVSVKATTEEGLGFTGDGNAMSAQAICIIKD